MPAARVTIPKNLPADVRKEAQALVRMLGKRLRKEDVYLVSMLAAAWTTWLQATNDVAEQGRVVMSGGTAIANPSLGVASAAASQVITLAKELGLSPTARKKLLRRRGTQNGADSIEGCFS